MTHNEKLAKQFVEVVSLLASKPENLDNLECYLSHHFPVWMEKYANTPENLVSELRDFATMEI